MYTMKVGFTATVLLVALSASLWSAHAASPAAALPATTTPPCHVRATVHLAAVTPDSVNLVWRFEPDDRWYLYAPYRNDTGFPPSVELDLPAGWTAGPLQFPAPVRKVLPGDILDHIYSSELLLLQTLHTGGRPSVAGQTITARLAWLACRELCVPGQVVLTVPVAGGASDPRAVELWSQARRALPVALPAGTVTIEREAAVIRVTAPGASRLVFIPAESGPTLVDLIRDGDREGPILTLRLRPGPAAGNPLQGLLSIHYPSARQLTGTVVLP